MKLAIVLMATKECVNYWTGGNQILVNGSIYMKPSALVMTSSGAGKGTECITRRRRDTAHDGSSRYLSCCWVLNARCSQPDRKWNISLFVLPSYDHTKIFRCKYWTKETYETCDFSLLQHKFLLLILAHFFSWGNKYIFPSNASLFPFLHVSYKSLIWSNQTKTKASLRPSRAELLEISDRFKFSLFMIEVAL